MKRYESEPIIRSLVYLYNYKIAYCIMYNIWNRILYKYPSSDQSNSLLFLGGWDVKDEWMLNFISIFASFTVIISLFFLTLLVRQSTLFDFRTFKQVMSPEINPAQLWSFMLFIYVMDSVYKNVFGSLSRSPGVQYPLSLFT